MKTIILLLLVATGLSAQTQVISDFTGTSLTVSPADNYAGGASQGVQILGFSSNGAMVSGGVRNIPTMGRIGFAFGYYGSYPDIGGGATWVYNMGLDNSAGSTIYFDCVDVPETIIGIVASVDPTTTMSTHVYSNLVDGHFSNCSLRAWASSIPVTNPQFLGSSPTLTFTVLQACTVRVTVLTKSLKQFGLTPICECQVNMIDYSTPVSIVNEGVQIVALNPGAYTLNCNPIKGSGEVLMSVDVVSVP